MYSRGGLDVQRLEVVVFHRLTVVVLRQLSDKLHGVAGAHKLIDKAHFRNTSHVAVYLLPLRIVHPHQVAQPEAMGAAMVGAVTFNLYPDLSSAAAVMVKKRQLDFPADPVAQALFERFLGE